MFFTNKFNYFVTFSSYLSPFDHIMLIIFVYRLHFCTNLILESTPISEFFNPGLIVAFYRRNHIMDDRVKNKKNPIIRVICNEYYLKMEYICIR